MSAALDLSEKSGQVNRVGAATGLAEASRRIASGGGLSQNAPSLLLPLRFMLAGLAALFTGGLALVWRPEILATYHYNQYVIAVTHLFVLGWILTVVMGAMYQLVPVALETKLYSERLARWQFMCHVAGFSGMVWMFWTWNLKHVGHFASLLTVGVGLFVYNLARTLVRVPRWNVIATAIGCALGWLTLTVLAGLTIVTAKTAAELAELPAPAGALGALLHGLTAVGRWAGHFDQFAAMHAHAHLGVIGIFTMLIVGISYKLVPMFTLSEVQSRRRARWSVILLNIGLLGAFVSILARSRFKMLFALILVGALLIYGLETRAILRARKRRLLDWGIKYFLTALGCLAPLSLLGLVLSAPGLPLTVLTGQLENLYGFLALLGFVSFAIIGMLYKILPFLVWYGSYSSRIGLAKVPALSDLYSARLQALGYWTYLGGLLGTSVAIVLGQPVAIRAGAGCLVVSLLILAVNAGKVLTHFVKPRVEPLPAKPVARVAPTPAVARAGGSAPAGARSDACAPGLPTTISPL